MFVQNHHSLEELQRLTKALTKKRIWLRHQAVVLAKQGHSAGLTHHNSESGLAGKPCLLVKSKLLDHIFATFRQCIGEYSAL